VTGPESSVSVIVPTRDRPRSLAACLAALERQEGTTVEIVVVDDASTDAAAVADVVAGSPRARLVRARGHGPAAARNLGARAARGSCLCFTDDDCRPEPGWSAALSQRVRSGAVVVAGPTHVSNANAYAVAAQTITNHLVDASLDAHAEYVTFAPTCNIAASASLCREEPFDEQYPLAAGEDRAWCAVLAGRGIGIAYEPAARVLHEPDLDAQAFWRQQVRYGRGARRFHHHHHAGTGGMRQLAFYPALLRKGFAHGPFVGALVTLAQLATAVGFAREIAAIAGGSRPSGTPGDL